MRTIGVIFFVCLAALAIGQNRQKTIVLLSDSILLDSSIIAQHSVQMSNENSSFIENIDFKINYFTGYLLNIKLPKNTPLQVKYNVAYFNFGKIYQNKNTNIIDKEGRETQNPFLYSINESENLNTQIYDNGLKMNGSISRGLGLGNAQNVVVNSNLNLQLSGKINNDIEVLAAISDDNNPIQPEGNTQQLQDFDKVYIQLTKNKTQVIIGDFEMRKPTDSYFLNYNKKSRGAQVQSAFNIKPILGNKKDTATLQIGADAAISRGRFARNTLTAIEGNQGPYRLNGVNGELFIILISGTEAIYLDGEKLSRGEQNDYIIDYNSGEITFTPKRIITQYSRIVAEFQYSDRNYARTVFTTFTNYKTKNYTLRASYFTEQDDKNQPFQQTLNEAEKLVLANVGNKLNLAVISGANQVSEFSNSKILYRKTDTLGGIGVYVFTDLAGNDSLFYEVKFSNVGINNGSYIQAASAANGRVFKYVGINNGNFEPVILLTAPNKMEMLNAAIDFNTFKNTQVSVELAHSNFNRNLFSNLDKQNDKGFGAKVYINNKNELNNNWLWQNQINYEWVDNNFRYVERYRNVEFDRLFNRQLNNTNNTDTGYNEHILSAKTSIEKQKFFNAFYQLQLYNRNQNYVGLLNQIGGNFTYKNNQLNATAEYLTININNALLQQNIAQNETYKYQAGYARTQFKHQVGVNFLTEKSSFFKTNDTLLTGSFSYNQNNYFLQNTDTLKLKYRLDFTNRNDFQARNTDFYLASIAQNINATTVLKQNNGNRLNINFTFRNFEINDSSIKNLKPESTILARIEYDYAFLKRLFTANTYYQIGSGNELRRDFSYLEVPKGQGVYVWKDFNTDNIQQLNEFVIASFVDRNIANYIRVYLPTNSTIRTNSVQFNQTLNINPASIWLNKKGVFKILSRFNNQSGLRIERKIIADNTFDFVNPFHNLFNDTTLINVNSLARNTLFFNRSNATFGADWSFQDNQSKVILTNGIDSRRKLENSINTRWNANEFWTINLQYTFGERSYLSQFFIAQNYNYVFTDWKPKLIYQANKNFRTTLNASYFEAYNAKEYGNQKGKTTEFGIEMRYNFTQVGALSAKYSLFDVEFNGEAGSNLGYDMLQGLTTGNNQVWNLNLQQRIGQNIQINLNYDGRTSGISDTILHTGRMEARYIF
ncbi:MAG: hypothetical protein WCI53_04575 [Bacteroidota bacterium]|jgi:hypothetical protein